jgi:hypothetical protein
VVAAGRAAGLLGDAAPSPFRLHLALDLALLLVSVPGWAMAEFVGREVAPPHCGTVETPCDRNAVAPIDRP